MIIPDLPIWAWIIVVLFSLLALTLPFWMIVRLPYMKKMRAKAAAKSREALFFFWFLAYVSYLILVWVVLWGYGAL